MIALPYTRALAAAVLLLPTGLGAQRPSAAPRTAVPVAYEISFPNAVHHEAEVSILFSGLPARPLEVRMSRSSPGRYALHEFAKNVYNFRASDSQGRILTVQQANPHQWNMSGHDGTVRVRYTLFGDRADGTYAGIDRSMAHLNIPATFAWARGLEERAVRATFHSPDSSWSIATQLFPTSDSATFTAPTLQYFMDSPTHLGKQSWHQWPVSGNGRTYAIRIALHHLGTPEEEARYVDATKRIVQAARDVFGEFPDFDTGTYTFLATYLPWAAGDGMEHRNSTSLTSSGSLASSMIALLGTVSHEFFHAWNVERMRPTSLEPFDFEEANMSEELWLAEGFTSYYAPLLLRRAGVTDDHALGQAMAGAVNLAMHAPGRRYFSAVGMSRQAPFTDAAVSIDPQNKVNTFISYYPYGQAIALALDLELRVRGRTLDDFMKEMWRTFGAQRALAPVRTYTVADARAALARVSGDTLFASNFFARYIDGQQTPPFADLLRRAGFLVRPARPGIGWAGDVVVRHDSSGTTVASATLLGTPMHAAGVDRGDCIVSLAGVPMTGEDAWNAAFAFRRPGDVFPMTYTSRGQTVNTTLTLVEDPRIEIVPVEEAGETLDEPARRFRSRWFGQ